MTDQAIDVLARTVWGEARGCGYAGMSHVAMVVMNRVNHPRWWGHDVVSVCQAPYQFSCWLRSDPNRSKLLAVTDSDPVFNQALNIAVAAVAGTLQDVTDGADSYYAISMASPPSWTERATKTFADNWHAFYRVELPMVGTSTPGVPDGDPNAPTTSAQGRPPPADTADQLDNLYNPGA